MRCRRPVHLARRGIRRECVDGALERVDRRLDGAGLAWEVALGLADYRVRVGLDLLELGLQGADSTARAQAGRLIDRVLEVGSGRAVGGLAATATGERRPARERRRRRPARSTFQRHGGAVSPRSSRPKSMTTAPFESSPQSGRAPPRLPQRLRLACRSEPPVAEGPTVPLLRASMGGPTPLRR